MLALISAMQEELSAVIEAVAAEDVIELGGRRYHRGRHHGEDVVCVISRIGKVAAATTTAILLERFAPRAVVMTGTAGAIDPALAIGDVVIADRLVQHDLDARPLFRRFEIPELGVTELTPDPRLSDRLARAVSTFVVPDAVRALGITSPRVHRGLIASGDRFIAHPDEVAALRTALPGLLAVEMESAAVAQVCHEHGVPFAVARVISDSADHSAEVSFTQFLATAAGPYARMLVQAVLASDGGTG